VPWSDVDVLLLGRGGSRSITITNDKERLSEAEIERMIAEGEKFAAEDTLHRKRIETLNTLSSFVYGLNGQLKDRDGLGGKIGDEDKKVVWGVVEDGKAWIEERGAGASVEELEDKLAGELKLTVWLFFRWADVLGNRYSSCC